MNDPPCFAARLAKLYYLSCCFFTDGGELFLKIRVLQEVQFLNAGISTTGQAIADSSASINQPVNKDLHGVFAV